MSSAISPRRPTAAYKLLVYLLYNIAPERAVDTPVVQWISGGSHRGHLEVPSIRRLARLLGTESRRVNAWLIWLYEQGFIEHVSWSLDKRSVVLYIKKPSNT